MTEYVKPLGILGVGHLADFLVRGVRRSDSRPIYLGPRNAQRAKDLSREFDCVVCASNQDVLARADIVVVATPPANCLEAVSAVNWTSHHTLISMVAGVGHEAVAAAARPATVVRGIPAPSSATGVDTIPIFPQSEIACEALAALGRVIPLQSEREFKVLATVGLCQMWCYGLIEELAAEVMEAGIDRSTALRFVGEHLRSAGEFALSLPPGSDVGSVLAAEARPGTLTAAGLEVLQARHVFPAWRQAFAKALPMSGGSHLSGPKDAA